MKCEKCGFQPYAGDQKCINCGAKLSIINTEIPLENEILEKKEKKDNRYLLYIIVAIIALIVITFFVVKFLILKR